MGNFCCKFKFGDEVQEIITKRKGIVIEITFHSNGNTYYGLQFENEIINNLSSVVEYQLELIEEQKFHINE